jgi:SAM-dependent methyltransferase
MYTTNKDAHLMKFNHNYLIDYIVQAPLPLAIERIVECQLLSGMPFDAPILDIGCGEGLFANILFREKIDLGIDPNPTELERAKQLDGYIELVECYGNKINRPDGAYQTIFSNSVLEHIEEVEPVLREIYRLLAKGGRFYMTVPSDMFEQYSFINQILLNLGLRKVSEHYRAFYNRFWAHYHCYPVEKWVSLAEKTGFVLIESRTYAPRYLCALNDFLVPFSIFGLITKKIFNRWTLFPSLRRIVMFPISLLVRKLVQGAENVERGGLVFLALTKS